jgi:hypothetical protein
MRWAIGVTPLDTDLDHNAAPTLLSSLLTPLATPTSIITIEHHNQTSQSVPSVIAAIAAINNEVITLSGASIWHTKR